MYDSATHFAGHEVLNILGDGSESEEIFTSTLRKAKEEVGGVVIFHKLPSLINDKKALLLIGTNNVPDVRKNDIHCDWSEFVFEITNVENYHLVIDVNVGLLRKNASESTGGVFAKALSELWSSATHMK